MWSRLDDSLFDHRKIVVAGDLVGGHHGVATALGFYTAGLLYANRHLTDGFIPSSIVRRWPHSERPLFLAEVMVQAKLWECMDGGYRIHDFGHWNLPSDEVRARREADRERKRKARAAQHATGNGGAPTPRDRHRH